jgi:hypothetical protein
MTRQAIINAKEGLMIKNDGALLASGKCLFLEIAEGIPPFS